MMVVSEFLLYLEKALQKFETVSVSQNTLKDTVGQYVKTIMR